MNPRRLAFPFLAAALLSGGCLSDSPEKLIASAKEYSAKGDYSASAIQLRRLLQENPDHAEARFLLGRAALESGELQSAEKELRKARELGYANQEELVPALVRALVAQRQYDKVLSEFGDTKLSGAEGNVELHAARAVAYLAKGKRDDARAQVSAALALKADSPSARFAQARLKAADGDLEGAAKTTAEVAEKSPGMIEAMEFAADVAMARRKSEEAAKWYEAIVAKKPDHIAARYNLGLMRLREGKLDLAKAQLEGLEKSAKQSGATYHLKALVKLQERDVAAARDAILQSLKFAPEYLPAVLLAGVIEREQKNHGQAEQHLLKVLDRAPRHPVARQLLAATYLENGETSRAVDLAQRLVNKFPDDPEVLDFAARTHVAARDHARAVKLLEKAASLDPSNNQRRVRLAVARFAAGDGQRALVELESASKSDPRGQSDIIRFRAHMARKEYDKALAALTDIEKKTPDKPIAHDLRAIYHLARGNKAEARKSLEQALKVQPDHTQTVLGLARLDLEEKQPDAAQARLEASLKNDPKNVTTLLALAGVRAGSKAPTEEVRKLIDQAIGFEPKNPAPRVALVEFLMSRKEHKAAVGAAQEAVAALPENPRVVEMLGRVQLATGETGPAAETFARLVSMAPKSPGPLMLLAQAQLTSKNDQMAIESLQKAAALERRGGTQALAAIYGIHARAGRYPDAIRTAQEIQKRRPNEEGGFVLQGDAHAAAREWDKAIEAYRNGHAKSKSPLSLTRLDSALRAAGNKAAADKLVAEWTKANPKDMVVPAYLAESKMRANDLQGAAQAYQALHEKAPENALYLNNLAWVKGQLKDPKAIEYAEKAAKLAPNSPAVLDTLGWLLSEKGDNKRAISLLEQATGLAPDAHDVRLHYAKALLKDGQKDAARRELEVLVKLGDKYGGQPEVSALIAKL